MLINSLSVIMWTKLLFMKQFIEDDVGQANL